MKYWARVKNPSEKPLKWWYHKFLCELGYFISDKYYPSWGLRLYYRQLNKMCDIGWNLYGNPVKRL